MQTFLIASTDASFIENEIKNITLKLQISPVNLIDINPTTSLSISDVRKISQTTLLKPYGGGDRVVIIRSMEKATAEASNALLKFLEEPPHNNYIILVSSNINKLLATIVSRCQVVSDNNKISTKPFADRNETKKLLRQILTSSAGQRILLSQKIATTREEGIRFLGNLLMILENLLHHSDADIDLPPKDIAQLITKVSVAKNYLERYINFKATLDVLLLGFPNTDK